MIVKSIIVLLLLALTSGSVGKTKSKTVLCISIPFIGHLTPLLSQAIELYQRHDNEFNIYIISCSNVKTFVEKKIFNTRIKFLDIGECINETMLRSIMTYASEQNSTISGMWRLLSIVLREIYPKMYQQMLNRISPEIFQNQEKVAAVIDRATYAGVDFAKYHNVSSIINVASVLLSLGFDDIPFAQYNPSPFRDLPESVHTIGTNLLFRTIFPFVRFMAEFQTYIWLERPFNFLRQNQLNLNDWFSLSSYFRSHLMLVNSAFGLDYAQLVPPNIQMTGPMLPMKYSLDYYINQLSYEDRQWIEADQRPVIYINFGTCVPISNKQIQMIFKAVKSLDKYRIIWKITEDNELPVESSSRFRIAKWFSSGLGHLAHPNVRLFISHCGINSAHESIWLGTPIFCIPILADQQDMAQRVQDAGVGQWLHKINITSEQLKHVIESMLNDQEMLRTEKNIKRIQKLMRLSGGVERAVDLIEMFVDYGIESWVPIVNSYPWYAYYNLDVYIIWLILLIGAKMLIQRCCCRRRGNTREIQKAKTL